MDEDSACQSAYQSAYQVDITCQDAEPVVDPDRILAAVRHTLDRHGCKKAQLSIALVNDDCIAQLHQQHLGHTGPTDVLSFDLSVSRPDDGACVADDLDGEIVLSVQTAQREARRRGHSVLAEVVLYAVHGTLHLLGYDDRKAPDAARMHELEDDMLTDLGFGRVFRGTVH